jgi:heme exporter protein A
LRLSVQNLSCRRSGRLVFRTCRSSSALDRPSCDGTERRGKSSLLAIWRGACGRIQDASTWRTRGERTLPECLHFVGHQDALKGALTAEENLRFARDLLGDPSLEPREALERVGLAHAAHLPVAYLSAGQRRRVALARLLVAGRPLWLLDEPTAALDTASQETLLGLMRAHLAEGGLVIAATHQPLGLDGAREIRIERASPSPLEGEGGPRVSEGRERGLGFSTFPLSRLTPFATLSLQGREKYDAPLPRAPRPDLRLAARIGGSGTLGLVFFLMIVTLVPFALGPDLNLLARIGPAILWIAAVLSTLIGLDRLFQADEEDGSLDLLRAAPVPLELLVLAKVTAHWLTTGPAPGARSPRLRPPRGAHPDRHGRYGDDPPGRNPGPYLRGRGRRGPHRDPAARRADPRRPRAAPHDPDPDLRRSPPRTRPSAAPSRSGPRS